MPKKLRPFLSIILLLLAVGIGVYYLVRHHSLLRQFSHTPLTVSLLVLALYALMFGVLILILSVSIRICRKKINPNENARLNAHTLFINFFIPGQGGPAYRGVYLNKRYKLRVKNYIVATLLYYLFYAIVSVFLLFVSNRPWWQTVAALAGIAIVGSAAVIKYTNKIKLKKDALDLSSQALMYLFLATVLQAVVQIIIYTVELHSVNSHIHFSQVITYTGTANLALFASLTPGAIGIRESFLIFTERLHHISSGNIIVANVIDRSVYLIFLLLLLAIIIAVHIRGKVRLQKLPELLRQNISTKPPVYLKAARDSRKGN